MCLSSISVICEFALFIYLDYSEFISWDVLGYKKKVSISFSEPNIWIKSMLVYVSFVKPFNFFFFYYERVRSRTLCILGGIWCCP